jgi:hypothetical protein
MADRHTNKCPPSKAPKNAPTTLVARQISVENEQEKD